MLDSAPYRRRNPNEIHSLHQLPVLAIFAADERVRRARVGHAEFGRIPLQLLAGAIGYVAEVVRLRQPAGVLEVASGRLASLASVNPFRMMADGFRDERFRALEAGKIFLWQQQMLVVTGEQHAPVRANEEHAAVPLRNAGGSPDLRLVLTLV